MSEHDGNTMQAQMFTHLIDAAAMKADIEHLKMADRELTQRILTVLGELAADIKAVRTDMSTVPRQISECRNDMRTEVERDFPSKTEAMMMEQRIEKQISGTDRTLGRQIAEVDKKLDAGMADVTAQITRVDTKVDKIWIKITMVLVTILSIGGLVQWLLMTAHAAKVAAGG